MDRGLHGGGAIGGDGVQPTGGRAAGCGESADGDAGSTGRSAEQRVCRRLCCGIGDCVCGGRGDAEPADAGVGSAGTGSGVDLQLHQAGDAVVACGAGACAGDCASGSMDCRAGIAGLADYGVDGCGAALGGGIRCALRVPGL